VPGELLKHVIRSWNDDDAVTILRHCRAAMPQNAALHLAETVVPDDPAEFDAAQSATLRWCGCSGAPGSECVLSGAPHGEEARYLGSSVGGG
jgi:hypothetical protein